MKTSTKRMRCLLVRPEFLENTFYNLTAVLRLLRTRSAAPPLGLLVAAALLPKDWELRLVDHDVKALTDADLDWADIVFVSGIEPQHQPMLRVVRMAKAKGKLTVVGGPGATLQPDLYSEADFIVCGEAETTLPQLLDDLADGATSGVYSSTDFAVMTEAPVPRYDLANLSEYLMVGVQFCRGCPFTCEFCAQIEIYGRKPRCKTPDQVLAELQCLYDLGYRGMVDFGYDNLIGSIPRVTEVLRVMRDWSKQHDYPFFYSTEATINLAKQPEILELMQANDFRVLFVGIESADEVVLEQTNKGQNTRVRTVDAVRTFNEYGLTVNTGLIMGFDSETDETADRILEMVQRTGVFPSLVLPLHALPDTQLSKRLSVEGRLFSNGELPMNSDTRTDTATTGLNFCTARPRTEILRDLIHILEQLYDPQKHYARNLETAAHLCAKRKYRPSRSELVKLGRAFLRIVRTTGLDRSTRWPFWRTFGEVLVRNPRALEMVISQAALHSNYLDQSKSYIRALEDQIAQVERLGEPQYNKMALAGLPMA